MIRPASETVVVHGTACFRLASAIADTVLVSIRKKMTCGITIPNSSGLTAFQTGVGRPPALGWAWAQLPLQALARQKQRSTFSFHPFFSTVPAIKAQQVDRDQKKAMPVSKSALAPSQACAALAKIGPQEYDHCPINLIGENEHGRFRRGYRQYQPAGRP